MSLADFWRSRRLRRNPWWIPRFLGGVPDIEARLVDLLGLVALGLFFEQYDLAMLTSALKFIAEDFALAESELGGYLSLIRLGALPAFLLVPFADRFGRRRIFLASVIGLSLATFLTAFTQTVAQFVALQMLARTFMASCTAVAIVIITEEFPAEHRGWGIGMLSALAACGAGLGALLFSAINLLPYGWRALHVVGVVPVLLLPRFRRGLRETSRFERHRERRIGRPAASPLADWLQLLASLARTHPLRAGALAMAGGLGALGSISVFQFTAYFTLQVHAWSPAQYSAMVIFGGGIGIIGNIAAGRLGDRIGRRYVGLVFLGLFPFCAALFYHGPGWSVPIAFVLLVFCATAGEVVVRAFSTELFPTSHRGTSSGWLALVQTLGVAAGLGLLGLGTHHPGDIARMTSLLAFVTLIGGFFLLLLPETSRRELEVISYEEPA